MPRLNTSIALLLSGFALSGCATLIEGSNQNLTVSTNPPGALCTVNRAGTHLGVVSPTPGTLRLDKSKNDLTVSCSKDGFQQATNSYPSTFVGTTFGNLIAGGLVGIVVDAASGADFRYPDAVQLDLAPLAAPPPAMAPLALLPGEPDS